MKHIPFFYHRQKESNSKSEEMKSEAILELDRLAGIFIRLRNLSLLGKERIKISDHERRAKMEGYVQAFAHAADLVSKAKKNLQKKQSRNHKVQTNEMKNTMQSMYKIK